MYYLAGKLVENGVALERPVVVENPEPGDYIIAVGSNRYDVQGRLRQYCRQSDDGRWWLRKAPGIRFRIAVQSGTGLYGESIGGVWHTEIVSMQEALAFDRVILWRDDFSAVILVGEIGCAVSEALQILEWGDGKPGNITCRLID